MRNWAFKPLEAAHGIVYPQHYYSCTRCAQLIAAGFFCLKGVLGLWRDVEGHDGSRHDAMVGMTVSLDVYCVKLVMPMSPPCWSTGNCFPVERCS